MADQDYEDSGYTDEADSGASAISAALTGGQYTTPTALNYADKILRKNFNGSQERAEQTAYDKMLSTAEEAKRVLREARARIEARKYQKSIPWLEISSALSRPTRSGTIAESVGNVSKALVPVLKDKQKFQFDQEDALGGIDNSLVSIDSDMAKRELELRAMRRKSDGPLNVEALRTLGKTIKKDGTLSGRKSPYGEIAEDEGLEPGTDAYQKRVSQLRAEDIRVRQVTAGMDAEPISEEEKIKIGAQYGIPMPPMDPYKGKSLKARQQAEQIEQRHANTLLDKRGESIPDARKMIQSVDRFMALNQGVDSGIIAGLAPSITAAEQEMDALTVDMSRKLRSPGEGTTSDFDAKQFVAGTLSRKKKFEANRNIGLGFKAAKQLELDQYAFMQDYMALHGHLRGADTLWRNYLEENTIFDPKQPGKFQLNTARKNYHDYFRAQYGKQNPEQKYADGGRVQALKKILKSTQKVEPGHPKFTEAVKSSQAAGRLTPYEVGELLREHDQVIKSNPVGFYADGGVVDETMQGATLGFSDEMSNDTPNARADMLIGESRHPAQAQAARSGGTVALIMAGYQAAKRLGMTDAAIRMIPQSRLLQLGLAGLSGGIAMGAGRSEGENQGTQVGVSGLMGTGAGMLSGLAAKYGIMAPIDAIQNRMSKDPITRADRRLVGAMEKDKISAADMLATLKERQKAKLPTNALDLGGPNGEALAVEAASKTGPGSERLSSELSDRQSNVRERVSGHINQALKPDEFFSREDELTSNLYNNAKPIYEEAYAKSPSVKSKYFMELANTPDGKRAIKNAVRIMRNEGKTIGPADVAGMVRGPSLEFLDNVKRGLDDLISSEENNAGTYKATNLGRTMRGMRSKFLTELDTISPDYKTAREQYAGDLEVRDALRTGREDFASFTPEEIRRRVGKMSFAERDAFRSGVAQHLFERIGQPSSDINPAQNLVGSPDTVSRLEAMFDKPQEFTIFKSALDREAADFKKNRKILAAGDRGRARAAGASHNLLGAVDESMGNFQPRYGVMNTAMALLRFKVPMSTKTANRISDVLAKSDPKELQAFAKNLESKSKILASRKGRAGKVAALAAVLGGAAMAPGPKGENLDLTGRDFPPEDADE